MQGKMISWQDRKIKLKKKKKHDPELAFLS